MAFVDRITRQGLAKITILVTARHFWLFTAAGRTQERVFRRVRRCRRETPFQQPLLRAGEKLDGTPHRTEPGAVPEAAACPEECLLHQRVPQYQQHDAA